MFFIGIQQRRFFKFLTEAPNDALYTQIKVVSIIAINGLLRLNELVSFDWQNISEGTVEDHSESGPQSVPIIQLSVTRSNALDPKQ